MSRFSIYIVTVKLLTGEIETKWGWGSLAYTRISYQNDKKVSKHAKYLKLERTQIMKGLGWGVVEKLRLKPG